MREYMGRGESILRRFWFDSRAEIPQMRLLSALLADMGCENEGLGLIKYSLKAKVTEMYSTSNIKKMIRDEMEPSSSYL